MTTARRRSRSEGSFKDAHPTIPDRAAPPSLGAAREEQDVDERLLLPDGLVVVPAVDRREEGPQRREEVPPATRARRSRKPAEAPAKRLGQGTSLDEGPPDAVEEEVREGYRVVSRLLDPLDLESRGDDARDELAWAVEAFVSGPDPDERARSEGGAAKGGPDPVDRVPEERVVLVRDGDREETAGPKDTADLSQHRPVIGEVLEDLGRQDAIKRGVAEREKQRVTAKEGRGRRRRARLEEALQPRVQARRSHARRRRGERAEEDSRPAAEVEEGDPGAQVERGEEPQDTAPEGHVELVEQERREALAVEPGFGCGVVRQRAKSTGFGGLLPSRSSRRAIRILSVLTYYRPHWTGLTVHAVRLAEGLARRGHEVTVLTTRHEPSLSREEVVDGVRVVRLRPLAGFNRGMIVPGLPFALARLLGETDVVQMHTPLPEALLVAGLARAFGIPVLMTHHGDVVMPPSLREKAIEAAAFVVLSGAARLASAVTTYSDDYAASSRLLVGVREKVRAIAPPVTLPEPDREASTRWRAELGLTGKSIVGFAGRFVSEKGFDVLLRALPLLRTRVPDVHLVFAGEANVHYERFFEQCRPLVTAAGDRLVLLGLLRDPQRIADFHAMCDVFALPSRSEMMALVQVEAMLAGTPVVATDIPGARVVVRDTGYGLLCEPESPESLAGALAEALLRRDALRPDRVRVARLFSPEESIGRNEELLGSLIPVAIRQTCP